MFNDFEAGMKLNIFSLLYGRGHFVLLFATNILPPGISVYNRLRSSADFLLIFEFEFEIKLNLAHIRTFKSII